jgi:hypothetical protein
VEVRTLSGSGLVLRRAGVGRVESLDREGGTIRDLAVGFAVAPTAVLTSLRAVSPDGSRPDAEQLSFVRDGSPRVRASHVDLDPELEVAIVHLELAVEDALPVLEARRGARWRVPGARLGGVVTDEGTRGELRTIDIVPDPETDAHPGLVGSPLLLEEPWGAAIGMLVEAMAGPLGPPPGTSRLTPVLRAVPLDQIVERHGLGPNAGRERPEPKRRTRPLADLVTLPMPGGDLPVVRDVDPALLGFDGPYRPRHEDQALRSGIRNADASVVSGPAGAGKSRAQFEAVRAELPDARFVVPRRGVDILPDLARHPTLEGEPRDVVIWLDPLEAFVFRGSGLKPAFDSFRRRRPRTVLVATLGEGAEESLSDGTPEGAAAREILREAMTSEITEPFPEADEDPVARLEERVRRWRSEENRPFLAETLLQLAAALAAQGDRKRAFDAAGEALNIHRELESSNAVYRDHVAEDFLAIAGYIDAHDDAVRYAGEAVERYRSLAEDHAPGRYDTRIAGALLAYAEHLRALGAEEEAHAAEEEAEELRRRAERGAADDVA